MLCVRLSVAVVSKVEDAKMALLASILLQEYLNNLNILCFLGGG